MILCVFKNVAYFSNFLLKFSESLAYEAIFILLLYYFDFQKLKKHLQNLFSYCHNVNFFLFQKKHILVIFCIIFQKNDMSSDVIIAIATVLIFFPTTFFVTLQSITVPNFHDLGKGMALYSPHLGHGQKKLPRGR